MKREVELLTDSKSARDLLHKVGLGRLKHVETRRLWLQQAVQEGRLSLHKVDTESNLADLLTKAMQRQRLEDLRERLGVLPGL